MLSETQLQKAHERGFPTFEQYAKNPSRYIKQFRGGEHDSLDAVANGSSIRGLRDATKEVEYHILQYKTKKLEEIERIARDNGIDLRRMKFKAIIQNMGGQNGQIVVRFMSPEEYERR